jgi:D-isomer specific 2-hydroxyacid dehydrogenase, NAD binding domain
MRAIVWGRKASLARAAADGFEAATFHGLFAESDVASLHLKLTTETTGSVSADVLGSMKPTSLLVNTARAGLIEPGALNVALGPADPVPRRSTSSTTSPSSVAAIPSSHDRTRSARPTSATWRLNAANRPCGWSQ